MDFIFTTKENCKSYDNPKTIEINEWPILLNPWNGGRVLSNMFTINDENIFSGIQHKLNVVNQIIIPIGIIICGGGNHSQFAARFKNKGETIITHELDISDLYADLKFDGEEFVYKDTQKIDLSSFPPIIKFYAGVLFELGRYFI